MADEVDVNKVVSWLNAHWHGDTTCPVCRHNDWGVGTRLFEVREFHSGGLVVGFTMIQPLVLITCRVCGHVLLFNAAATGAWSPHTKTDPPAPVTPPPRTCHDQ